MYERALLEWEVVSLVAGRGTAISDIDAAERVSVFDSAVSRQRPSALELLLDHGMSPNMEPDGERLLSRARGKKLWEFAKVLAENGILLPEMVLSRDSSPIREYLCNLC